MKVYILALFMISGKRIEYFIIKTMMILFITLRKFPCIPSILKSFIQKAIEVCRMHVHLWDEPHLAMMYNPFYILLVLVY